MKLVDDWKDSWKWISTNCMMVATALQGTWLALPDDMKIELPKHLVNIMTIVVLVAGFAGRLVKQGSGDAPPSS